ncbi:uncharacterized protein LOC122809170 [Protopterus annectens]|uniref:uncharacterized protein LOC122809170 n=1 Tax=Protopterus annectens TaxID=7888 RepID=UPI001CFA4598|nr:uncharacterized protein LOC122809170 [Protopterus annectens]XP_043936394.1 uncharacterized protein LOC122809170 [Protopterus annectens]
MPACGTPVGLQPLWFGLCFVMLIKLSSGDSAMVDYVFRPQNVTSQPGQDVVFKCAINSTTNFQNSNISIRFDIAGYDINYRSVCPSRSEPDLNLPLARAKITCTPREKSIVATLVITNTQNVDNLAMITCTPLGSSLPNSTAFLIIQSNTGSSTGVKFLLACVLGGFFGVILVFVVLALLYRKYGKDVDTDSEDEDPDNRKTAVYVMETDMFPYGNQQNCSKY